MRRQLLFLFRISKIARGLILENKGLREIRKGYYEEVWRNPQFGHDILVIKSLFFLFSREFYNEYYEGNFINLKGEYIYVYALL